MKIKKEMILREIAGENILVPGANAVLELNGLFVVTETGAFIWKNLTLVESEEELVEKMLDEYEIGKETAEKDIAEFLNKLRDFGIID
ncbi:MAG: PqqD family protein [Clostridia bacterium]|nr:PqqD family protein [Clostridia bacterium]